MRNIMSADGGHYGDRYGTGKMRPFTAGPKPHPLVQRRKVRLALGDALLGSRKAAGQAVQLPLQRRDAFKHLRR